MNHIKWLISLLTAATVKMYLQISVCLALLAGLSSVHSQDEKRVGGKTPSSADPDIIDFAVGKLDALYKATNNPLFPNSVEVIGSTTQVVAGIKHDIYFLVKTADKKLEICEVSVWVRSWLGKDEVTQLAQPIKCGVPDDVVAELERKANEKSNNFMYAKSIKKPNLVKGDDNIMIRNLILYKTNCSRYEQDLTSCEGNIMRPVRVVFFSFKCFLNIRYDIISVVEVQACSSLLGTSGPGLVIYDVEVHAWSSLVWTSRLGLVIYDVEVHAWSSLVWTSRLGLIISDVDVHAWSSLVWTPRLGLVISDVDVHAWSSLVWTSRLGLIIYVVNVHAWSSLVWTSRLGLVIYDVEVQV
ncbi:type 2 cystatin [Plakobranchus ocellatus]|uniref:Type 2 cystatin n=1 Tax=Plakobranchus ocellatus TaxID=259542 RepID=A0AAV4BEL2_9GAST|nr:type 2 cystatin [Plakobranchus ocellatus]